MKKCVPLGPIVFFHPIYSQSHQLRGAPCERALRVLGLSSNFSLCAVPVATRCVFTMILVPCTFKKSNPSWILLLDIQKNLDVGQKMLSAPLGDVSRACLGVLEI
jgi:hypothetical protein